MIKQYARLGLILAAFAATACVGLAFVYQATEKQIAANQDKQLNESLADLFPAADAFKDVGEGFPAATGDTKVLSAYAATKAGSLLGVAIRATGPSYGGPAVLLVGLGTDRKVSGVRVLSLVDTPGLGQNANNPGYFVNKARKLTFAGQFAGKSLGDAFVVKQDVDAISASTITSRSLTTIIKASADAGQAWVERNAPGGN
jgi:Na+-translocating ferredoxin:NAD+ oxidoreductase subunit G